MDNTPLSAARAHDYAGWFRLLADPARVQIVSELATAGGPLSVPQIVAAVQAGPATVAQHLNVLAAGRLVLAERRGTARLYRLNQACVPIFPPAAGVVSGHPAAQPAAAAAVAAAGPGPVAGRGPADIRAMCAADAAQVLAIYQAGLDAGQASFETQAPSWAAFDAARLPGHRYVAADPGTGRLLGWVAVSPVSSRPVYAGVVEHSVYVDPAAQRRGVGAGLLRALISSTEAAGVWTIQSGIFPENTASLRLHERAGFRVVGVRERLGRHCGRWRDVVLLERRSSRPDPAG
ncbi:MAG TPA: metalloregulator ArsR/SmtB family transcription factor [Streptosporangiaceae bacterium]|nr:metalloregulator ArsR/SmtB family transcription factor [Streptosporangiaceae bacterium]